MTLVLTETHAEQQVDTSEIMLTDTLLLFPISCGRNLGHKLRTGDMRTPEGTFRVTSIEDASDWGHDFHDGNGFIRHAYGPWFFRLSFGHGIGIHGTHDPASMGLRATEGCIRLRNEDLQKLRPYIKIGMWVEILPDTFTPLLHYPEPMPVPSSAALAPIEVESPVLTYHAAPRRRHRR
ncbi:MAG: L,D-transpeptidase [Bacteroidales bacterium]|nr:L,D-transpeptidase [Bacteroidales bacterium]